MHRATSLALALIPLSSACVYSNNRAPGPELDHLRLEAHGTLIETADVIPAYPKVRLTDVPSMRELEFRLRYQPVRYCGLNEQGQFVYTRWKRVSVPLVEFLFSPDYRPQVELCLQQVNLVDSTEHELGIVDRSARVLEFSPKGCLLVVAGGHDLTAVHVLDTSTGEWRTVLHDLGEVLRCDWLPDGRAFALSGAAGGALIDAHGLRCIRRQSQPFGPFAPDSNTYLSMREEGNALMALDSTREPLEIPPLPLARAPETLVGMCGPRHAICLAFPTLGQSIRWEGELGAPWIRYEMDAVKVVDLEAGTYATILTAADGYVGWLPIRLELLQR